MVLVERHMGKRVVRVMRFDGEETCGVPTLALLKYVEQLSWGLKLKVLRLGYEAEVGVAITVIFH